MKTIRRQLLSWLLGGMLAATLVAGLATFLKVRGETNELFDYQIRQIAASFPALPTSALIPLQNDDPDEDSVILAWDGKGALIFSSKPQVRLPRLETPGYRTVVVDGKRWRMYGHPPHPDTGMLMQIAQPVEVRDELAAGLALRSLLPFLALVPVLALLIWIVVGRSLRPLNRLAVALGTRSPHAMHALEIDSYPPELRPMLNALNLLFGKLGHAMAVQRTFVADAAHELRTPLAALKLQLQLVERETDDDARFAGFRKLDDRINRATHLVQQLLTLARQEEIVPNIAPGLVDLRLLAGAVVADFKPLAEHRRIDLCLKTQAPPYVADGRPDTLRIMLGNLVDNALRYTANDGEGRVDVVVGHQDGRPAVFVIDNGPGVARAERLRIFDRFYRGEHSGNGGSGLGLAIVKHIADRHHADIVLRDAPGGRGLAITVLFPLPSQ